MNDHTKAIAGTATAVADRLAGVVLGTDAKAIQRRYKALGLLATFPPDLNVVVTFVYPGTKREHITVQPCHIVAK